MSCCSEHNHESMSPWPASLKRKAQDRIKEEDVSGSTLRLFTSRPKPWEALDNEILSLSCDLRKRLTEPVLNDYIQDCGQGPLSALKTHPEDVLRLAHEKLHTYPYREVPVEWRRLYEEASLQKVNLSLRAGLSAWPRDAPLETISHVAKKRRLDQVHMAEADLEYWIDEVVDVLDMAISMSGAPARKNLFDWLFERLAKVLVDSKTHSLLNEWPVGPDNDVHLNHPIDVWNAEGDHPPSLEEFQDYLDTKITPLRIKGALAEWPAMNTWNNPAYFMRVALGGRRRVPIELGRSYTDEGWGQKFMTFAQFMHDYLLPEKPTETGYLAQHDLFSQMPALRNDIIVPDYCYTSPPPVKAAGPGLPPPPELDDPLLNAWLGPGGTISPLHTDPYHNMLCQVFGSKYVRLYSPEETLKLYPRGMDEAGVNMENNSFVDVSMAKQLYAKDGDMTMRTAFEDQHPLFKDAKYIECVLGPGECLYIPVGWWHYVESLSTSFSVSFWWN